MSQHSGDGAGGGVSTKILRIAFSFYRRFVAVTYFGIAIIEKEKRKTQTGEAGAAAQTLPSQAATQHLDT